MAGQDKIRISRILKDYNIGLGTLVKFLKSKGFEVQSNPREIVTPEELELIKKEFKEQKHIKEESRKVTERVREFNENSSSKSSEVDNKQDDSEEVIIRSTTFIPQEQPAKEEKIVSKESQASAEPVKAEIPAAFAETAKIPEQKKTEEPTKSENDKPVEPAENPEPVKKTEPVKNPEPVKPAETPEINKVPESPKHAETEKDAVHDNVQTTEAVKPAKPAYKDQGQKNKKPQKKNLQDRNAQSQRNNNLQSKSVKQDAKKKIEKVEEKHETPVIEHIETRVEKLEAPHIKGVIDLSQFEHKKKSGNQNDERKPHKKRERIKNQGEKVDIAKNAPRDNQKRGNKNNDNNDSRRKDRGRRSKERFKPTHTEIDEDLIQKQIKETYARMTEGKGKTKGSKHRREKREMISQKMEEERELQQLESKVLRVTEFVTVNELAIMMNNTPVTKVIEACMNLGLMVSINQRLDAEALVLVAEEFGYEIEFVTAESNNQVEEEEDDPKDLVERPPIITVMGHVDHGKTSLLDHIRNSNVIAGEAGGITQHIGAYNVKLSSGRRITFLDTPGHEAFTAMRARGAKITDLAIIIIAADDAIMPQTVEAINHAQAAGVPMVFAINKIDKPGAHPDKIREQLANRNILVEEWGGKYQCQEISAKKGINVDKLLEKVLVEADLLELKANPKRRAKGTVIESSLDKGRGYLATVLVQNGTLRVGDIILSGSYYGKVKAMFNERGQKITEASPSTPASVLGLNGAPTAGENFNVMEDEKEAKEIANKREQLLRIQGLRTQKHITLEELGRRIAIGNFQELNVIVKGDVDGSIEALSDSLIKLSTKEIVLNVIHKAVGGISESDVLLAAASNAIIIGFQVRPTLNARKLAEKEEIEIRLYSVIYDAINDVKSGIEGMLAPIEKEEVTATAEVQETFKISKVGTIAGCIVKEGKLTRTAKIRVIRDGIVVHTGELGSLKRFKDDVKEVATGLDCGLNIENFNDVKIGDVIEAYQIVEIKRKL